MPDFAGARGVGAMEPASRSSGSRSGGFWNYFRWSDGDTKHIAWLTPASDLVTVNLHEWVKVGKTKSGKDRYAFFIDRRDPCIGEDSDDLTDRLDVLSKRKTLGVAVELEPTYVTANNRKKVSGFQVKMETFTRTNDDGDEEEVQAPVIGIVNQSRGNFYRWFASFAESYDPLEDVAFEVKRQGGDRETTYITVPLSAIPVDYSNLVANISNVGALSRSDKDLIQERMDAYSDDKDKALAIGATYLDSCLEDLADGEKYAELVAPITYIEDKFGNRKERKEAPRAAEPTFDEMIPPVEESKIDRLRREYAKK